jgi:hypothetical protein
MAKFKLKQPVQPFKHTPKIKLPRHKKRARPSNPLPTGGVKRDSPPKSCFFQKHTQNPFIDYFNVQTKQPCLNKYRQV